MKICELVDTSYNFEINGITDDSREVKDGFLFVATKGFNVDHFDYIEDAIENGASFVICDREISFDIPHLIVSNINDFFHDCCMRFYDINPQDFQFIGITGTDGKTTTASLVKEINSDMAYIGTNGVSFLDKEFKTNNTTPCISEICKELRLIKDSGIKKIVMEVSSEALLHDRVRDFRYDIVGFTNITEDHLNVHKTIKGYIESKMKLLNLVKDNGYVVVNGDDEVLSKIKSNNLITFGFKRSNDFVISSVEYGDLTKIELVYGNKAFEIKSHFVGKYNVYNVVMAFIISFLQKKKIDDITNSIEQVNSIKGRCERLDFLQDYSIILDYAHTVNGIKNVLDTFSSCGKRLITVTGCAGGREKEKRSAIGNLVMEKSDVSIFTMDDPRYEDVSDIIDQMVGDRHDYIRILDRREAINYALTIAHCGDIVLILGKGRDNYMAIGDEKIDYNDYDVIKEFFEKG